MLLQTKNNLQFITFSGLNAFNTIRHGIFTRNNGYSENNYKSLNVGLAVGDDEKAVEKNRAAISKAMKAQTIEYARQVHGTDILIFKKNHDPSKSASFGLPETADAMITDIPGKFLVIQVADCQAILLHDPGKNVVANIHSGWRGSTQNIIGKCIAAMTSEFGCRPEQLIAGISPSLGPCCAEFLHYTQEIPEKYWDFKNANHYFDFWGISRRQLSDAGILPENVRTANICTKCNPHLFYSYRKKPHTGRFAAVIGLK